MAKKGISALTSAAMFVAAASIVLVAQQAYATQTLRLSKGVETYSIRSGGSIHDEVVVTALGDTEIPKVLVYAADMKDHGDQRDYEPAGKETTAPISPSAWIEMSADGMGMKGNTPFLVLKPNESATVSFSVNVPEDAPPGDYTAVLFFEIDNTGEVPAGSSPVNAKIGMKMQIRVHGEFTQGISARLKSPPSIVFSPKVPVAAVFSNNGNIDTLVSAEVYAKEKMLSSKHSTILSFSKERIPAFEDEYEKQGVLKADPSWLPHLYEVGINGTYVHEPAMLDFSFESGTSTLLYIPVWLLSAFAALLVLGAMTLVGKIAKKFAARKANDVGAAVEEKLQGDGAMEGAAQAASGEPSAKQRTVDDAALIEERSDEQASTDPAAPGHEGHQAAATATISVSRPKTHPCLEQMQQRPRRLDRHSKKKIEKHLRSKKKRA